MYRKDGYVADTEFTHHFYRELSPTFINFAAAVSGYAAPDITKPFRYIEIGSGQGITTNILAATHPKGEFVGIDFNPSQIAKSRAMAEEAGLTNIEFRQESFQEAATKDDHEIKPADYICLHGIYSWVGLEARQSIFDFISKKLRAGGIVYISYNSMPGWAELHPIRQFFYEYSNLLNGSSLERACDVVSAAQKMLSSDMEFFKQNPKSIQRMEEMVHKSPNYISHEYLHKNWPLCYVTEMRRHFSDLYIDSIGNAEPIENFDNLYFEDDVIKIIQMAEDQNIKEMLKDFACNQWFRRDLFGKGTPKLNEHQMFDRLNNVKFIATKNEDELNFNFETYQGQATLNESKYLPIPGHLENSPRTIGELCHLTGLSFEIVIQGVSALLASGDIHMEAVGEVDHKAGARLNDVIAKRIEHGEPYRTIAAPKIGNGIDVNAIEAIAAPFLQENPETNEDEMARYLNEKLGKFKGKIPLSGKYQEYEDVSIEFISRSVENITKTKLNLWNGIGVL